MSTHVCIAGICGVRASDCVYGPILLRDESSWMLMEGTGSRSRSHTCPGFLPMRRNVHRTLATVAYVLEAP